MKKRNEKIFFLQGIPNLKRTAAMIQNELFLRSDKISMCRKHNAEMTLMHAIDCDLLKTGKTIQKIAKDVKNFLTTTDWRHFKVGKKILHFNGPDWTKLMEERDQLT